MSKLIRKLKTMLEVFKQDCCFSLQLALLRFGDDITNRLQLKKLSGFLHKQKDVWILKYLRRILREEILKYKNVKDVGEYQEKAPIWVCWWSGEENAPALVQQCIKSIRKYAGNHPVNFVTKDNYMEFLNIPEFILEKLSVGDMCIANFTDYLRFSLLEKYGGLWLDATIYLSQELPESYFRNPLFTCKSPERDCRYISKYCWTSFCFGGWKMNPLFSFFINSFEKYWASHNVAIDYLFVDYLINIANENILIINEQLMKVPINNIHRDDLQAAMNVAMDEIEWMNVLNPDTIIYKLSWREAYSKYTEQGKKSIYARFLDMDI